MLLLLSLLLGSHERQAVGAEAHKFNFSGRLDGCSYGLACHGVPGLGKAATYQLRKRQRLAVLIVLFLLGEVAPRNDHSPIWRDPGVVYSGHLPFRTFQLRR